MALFVLATGRREPLSTVLGSGQTLCVFQQFLAAGEGCQWVSVMSCCAPDPDADAQSILTRVARTLSGSTVTQTQWLMCTHTWVDILAP